MGDHRAVLLAGLIVAGFAGPTLAQSGTSIEALIDRLGALERRLDELRGRAGGTETPAPQAREPSARRRGREGWLVDLREVTDGRVSEVSLGQITVPAGALSLGQHLQRGVSLASTPAYKAEGLLVARQEGTWTLQISLEHPGAGRRMSWRPVCISELWVGTEQYRTRAEIGPADGPQVAERSLTIPLAPGLHRIAATLACLDAQGTEKAQSVAVNREARLTLKLRAPGEPLLRSLRDEDIIHLLD